VLQKQDGLEGKSQQQVGKRAALGASSRSSVDGKRNTVLKREV
jgi:hypothetical protein